MVSFVMFPTIMALCLVTLGMASVSVPPSHSPPFYEPDHPFVLPTISDQRSPSALINTLANHGYVDRSGIQVDLLDMAIQLEAVFNMHSEFVFLSHVSPAIECGVTTEDDSGNIFVDLADLFGCDAFDSILVRFDHNPTVVDPILSQDLFMISSSDNTTGAEALLTIEDLMIFHFDRIIHTILENPNATFTSRDYLAQNLLLLTLVGSDPTLKTVQSQRLSTLLTEERFPEGFLPGTLREGMPYHFLDPTDPIMPLVDEVLMSVQAALSLFGLNDTSGTSPPGFEESFPPGFEETPPPEFSDDLPPDFSDGPPPDSFDGTPPEFSDDGFPPDSFDGTPPEFSDDFSPPDLAPSEFLPNSPVASPMDGFFTDVPTFEGPISPTTSSNETTSAPSSQFFTDVPTFEGPIAPTTSSNKTTSAPSVQTSVPPFSEIDPIVSDTTNTPTFSTSMRPTLTPSLYSGSGSPWPTIAPTYAPSSAKPTDEPTFEPTDDSTFEPTDEQDDMPETDMPSILVEMKDIEMIDKITPQKVMPTGNPTDESVDTEDRALQGEQRTNEDNQ
jgi:hypothetical protein